MTVTEAHETVPATALRGAGTGARTEPVVELLNESLQWLQNAAFVVVAIWALLRWRRRRDEASRWLAATFASLGAVVLVSAVLDLLPDTAVSGFIERGLVAVLVVFPYLLLRFADAFEPFPARSRRILGVAVLGLAVTGLLIRVPGPGETRTVLFAVFAGLVVLTWVSVLPLVGLRFWRAGQQQPTVSRRRLRLLSVGTVSLTLAIVLAGLVPTRTETVSLVTTLFALGAAATFLLGFAPPSGLRRLWRQSEEEALHAAALGLMTTTTEDEVATALIPHLRKVVAARGVALVHRGRLLGAEGVTAREAAAAVHYDESGALQCRLSEGAIHVWTDTYTPFFGDDEVSLFERVGLLADLALDRAGLLASERASRAALEHANAELETFVYSASHDLKSPLIAMLGYVDLLIEEHRDQLGEEGRWYVDRMATNGRYMESLIRDLLELSRVGRMQTSPDRVELAPLLADVAHEVTEQHPGLQVDLQALPVLEVNAVRVRQLFTNLLENAARHGGDEVRVTVVAEHDVEEPGDAVVVVSDDGPGVAEPYRELVFGLFERLTANTPGTGIGLAICRKILESIGGRIWLGDPDGGAEFRLRFPPETVIAGASGTTDGNETTEEVHA